MNKAPSTLCSIGFANRLPEPADQTDLARLVNQQRML